VNTKNNRPSPARSWGPAALLFALGALLVACLLVAAAAGGRDLPLGGHWSLGLRRSTSAPGEMASPCGAS
jgi:hypothetical protein